MQFQSSFITQAGSNLFASATSSINSQLKKPVVWMYARTYSLDTSRYKPDQMRALDVTALTTGSGNKQTSIGNITSAELCDATDSSSGTPVQIPTVRLTCTLSNTDTYYGLARNLAVFAKLQGQADASAVLVAIARVDAGYHVDEIPRKSDGDFTATIDFVLAIKDSQINTIQAPSSYYASAQTVQNLADRVVTTHLANDTTTGEPQDIYGIKTFKDRIYHNNNVVPSANNAYSLGMLDANNSNNDRRWNTVYATTFNGTTFTGTAAIATNLEVSPELTWTTASSSSAGSTLQVKAGGKNSNSITIDKVQKAYSPYINASDSNANYYIVLGDSISAGATFSAGFKNLYADSVNSFYYNTSTNKLTCPVFSGNVVTQYIAECTTSKSTVNKTATIDNFTLTAGTRVFIKFTKGNSAISPTLNISSKGAKSINHLRIDLPENSVVPLIYNGDSWDVEGSFSTVTSVEIRGKNNSSSYPVIFADSFCTDTSTYTRKSLYTNSVFKNALRYNPNTNVCYCKIFSGSLSGNATSASKIHVATVSDDKAYPLVFRESYTADVGLSPGNKIIYSSALNKFYYNPSTDTLTVKNIDVTNNIELGESGIVNLASYFGINLQIIDIYCSGVVNPGYNITFSSGNVVMTGTGGYAHGGSTNHSNYTVCEHNTTDIIPDTIYKITKMISAGQNSYNQIQNYNGIDIAKPGKGTPCICFATIVNYNSV